MSHPKSNYLQKVRDQYEDYPYPPCVPENDKSALVTTFFDSLDQINHYCFGGKEDFQNHFRVLVAGGGTGDATIYLAEQLRHTNAEIVYVDISSASMAMAKQRAEIRDLRNITWVHDSLLEVPNLNLGTFDYINCCGVLHHLASPDAGLQALKSVLRDDGAMGIMVYAQYGRSAVYHVQALMRLLGKHIASPQEKVDVCKAVLAQLPAGNLFAPDAQQINNDMHFTDIDIYDLLLHSQDRAYSLPEFYDWIESNGLHAMSLASRRGASKSLYNPQSYIQNETLIQKTSTYPLRNQQAIAELAAGNIIMHSAFIAKNPRPLPKADDLDNVPALSIGIVAPDKYDELLACCLAQNPAVQNGSFLLERARDHTSVIITSQLYTLDLFRFIDGERTIGEIVESALHFRNLADNAENRAELLRQFAQLFDEINRFDWFLLRGKSIAQNKTIAELQDPITAKYTDPIAKKRT